jgi:fructose-1-phosphate kinase PfkB-like protein
MILTLTLNPCIDFEVEVRRLVRDDINRVVARHREAAGKGIKDRKSVV